jgi:hypothetical protein
LHEAVAVVMVAGAKVAPHELPPAFTVTAPSA